MTNFYQLLDVAPDADIDTIKRAFRREIARYHPDKVQHLGPEFQQMATERAAALTAAYKTLTDEGLRAAHDAELGAGRAVPPPAPSAPSPPLATPESTGSPDPEPPPGPPGRHRFEEARAGRDLILLRAVTDHVRAAVADVYGASDEAHVKGFDLVLVPRGGGGLLKTAAPPRVLVKVAERVDEAVAVEAWTAAARARLHLTGAPLCVLLIGSALAPDRDIVGALDRQRARQIPGTPTSLTVVPVDVRDWSPRVPSEAPAPVRRFVNRLGKWG